METLKQMIKSREETPISFEQIQKVLKGHTSAKFNMLDDLPEHPTDGHIFGSHDCCCLLCTLHSGGVATNTNHWVCIIKAKGEYWFADSLGHDPAGLTARLHNGHKALINWSTGKKVVSQRTKIQKFQSNIQDCGAHVACRLCMKHLAPRRYIHWLKHALFSDTDLTVSMLTFLDLFKAK